MEPYGFAFFWFLWVWVLGLVHIVLAFIRWRQEKAEYKSYLISTLIIFMSYGIIITGAKFGYIIPV